MTDIIDIETDIAKFYPLITHGQLTVISHKVNEMIIIRNSSKAVVRLKGYHQTTLLGKSYLGDWRH